MSTSYRVSQKKVSGILAVVPRRTVRFADELDHYGLTREKGAALQETIGFSERRVVEGNTCGSDLCVAGMEHLFRKGLLDVRDIGAIVYVTQTPDRFMPATSAILHGRLGCPRDVLCIDINHGCTGYLYGLIESFLLLQITDRKVVLLNADTLSRRTCPYDRNINPMIGDAGTVTVVENSGDGGEIVFNMLTDGSRSDWLTIPAGAFRLPSSESTREIKVLPDGNRRSEEDFFMNGSGIFTFTQTDVAAAIQDLFASTGRSMGSIDYFMFHQPNRFMLQRIARKLGVPETRMPNNVVEKFGNSSSASIPVAISHNIAGELLEKKLSICMAGFGAGLAWGAMIMDMGPLDFCEMIET